MCCFRPCIVQIWWYFLCKHKQYLFANYKYLLFLVFCFFLKSTRKYFSFASVSIEGKLLLRISRELLLESNRQIIPNTICLLLGKEISKKIFSISSGFFFFDVIYITSDIVSNTSTVSVCLNKVDHSSLFGFPNWRTDSSSLDSKIPITAALTDLTVYWSLSTFGRMLLISKWVKWSLFDLKTSNSFKSNGWRLFVGHEFKLLSPESISSMR